MLIEVRHQSFNFRVFIKCVSRRVPTVIRLARRDVLCNRYFSFGGRFILIYCFLPNTEKKKQKKLYNVFHVHLIHVLFKFQNNCKLLTVSKLPFQIRSVTKTSGSCQPRVNCKQERFSSFYSTHTD